MELNYTALNNRPLRKAFADRFWANRDEIVCACVMVFASIACFCALSTL